MNGTVTAAGSTIDAAGTPATTGATAAWLDVCHLHSRISRTVAAELEAHDSVPLATFEILVQIAAADDALRPTDLLRTVLISQPGLSRKIERLHVEGLIQRRPDPRDGRAVVLALTPAGRAALAQAAGVYEASIDRQFQEASGSAERTQVLRAFLAVLDVL